MVRRQFLMAFTRVMRGSEARACLQRLRSVTGPGTTWRDASRLLRAAGTRTQALASAVLMLTSAILSACSDGSGRAAGVAEPFVGVQAAVRGYSRNDSVRLGLFRHQTSPLSSTAAAGGQLRLVSLTPGDFQGYSQPETIVGVVSGSVQTVTVTGNGAITCTGSYGTIIGYDAVGVELGRKSLALIDPADCSPPDNPDDVTFGAQGTLVVTNGTIARFEITPMSPLEFPVFDQVGHASATYTITLGAAPPYFKVVCNPATPVRAQPVTCTATMSDGSQFTGKHLKSTDSAGRVIFDKDVTAPPGVTLGWPGPAIVSSRVEITATVNGKDTVATSSFSVQSRIGRLPGWMNEDVWDAGWSTTPPSPSYVNSGVPPLTANNPLTALYPGFVTPGSGYSAGEGALGVNVFVYSGELVVEQASSGPNTGMISVTSVPWFADGRYNGAAVGIYLMSSLKSNDPFYKRQKGPPPFCTQTNMQTIAGLLSAHENRHWTNGGAGIRALNTQRGYDGLIAYPDDPDPVGALGQAVTQLKQAYADTITAANTRTHSVSENYPVCDMRS